MRALLSLSVAIFVSMTTEFLPGGLIPKIADDLDLAVSAVGLMVSVFAFTVVAATAPIAAVTRRVAAKPLVLASMSVIALSSAGVALAPTFEIALASRIVGAMAHGAFWAVVIIYPAYLVPRGALARAMAVTAAGGSLAGIVGLPVGNALGQLLGWRSAFAVVAVAGLVTVAVLWRWLPAVELSRPAVGPTTARASHPLRDATLPIVAGVCVLILTMVIAQTAFSTYTAVWLVDVAGFDDATLPVYFLLTGLVGAVGVLVAGRAQDRYGTGALPVASVITGVAMTLFPVAAASGVASAVFAAGLLLSAAFAGIPMMLQARLMTGASPALRRVAGAAQTMAFNIGIGVGALAGGAVIDSVGLASLPLVAAGGVAGALALNLLFDRRRRRARAVMADRSAA